MNGSIASANNATLATVAANYHSLHIAARVTPLEVDTKVANGPPQRCSKLASQPRRLHLRPAGLQGGDRVRPAVGRQHFLGGLKDRSSPPGRSHHGSPRRRPRRQGGRKRALLSTVNGLDTPLEVDTKIANRALGLATKAFVAAGMPASQRSRAPRPTRRCWPATTR